MKVVVDTNVVVAGLLSPNGPPAAILNLVVNGRLQPLFDNRVLQEYIEVLGRDKFGFKAESADALIEYIREEGEYVSAEPTSETFVDEDDRAFYEVAVSGGAQYLITGNKSHFPKDSRVRNPREFLTVYGKSTESK
jgi:uncharacterized protein